MSAPKKPTPPWDVREKCPACDGTSTLRCDRCKGEGTFECYCNHGYTHEHDCDDCSGRGVLSCRECDGYGCLVAARGAAEAAAWSGAPADVSRLLLSLTWRAAAQDGPSGGRFRADSIAALWLGIRFAASADDTMALKRAGFTRTEWRDARRPRVREWVWASRRAISHWKGAPMHLAPADAVRILPGVDYDPEEADASARERPDHAAEHADD